MLLEMTEILSQSYQDRRIRTTGSLIQEVFQDLADGVRSWRSIHRLLDGTQGVNIPRHSDERRGIPAQTIRKRGILK